MDIKTKFNVGDKVFVINSFPEEVFETCETCNGSRQIKIKNKYFGCPECLGNGGKTKWLSKKWDIYNNKNGIMLEYDRVVKIEIEINKAEIVIRYMLGHRYTHSYCGALWLEEDIFGSIEEAEAECEKRNNEGKNEV